MFNHVIGPEQYDGIPLIAAMDLGGEADTTSPTIFTTSGH